MDMRGWCSAALPPAVKDGGWGALRTRIKPAAQVKRRAGAGSGWRRVAFAADKRGDLGQQTRGIEIDLVHGLSISSPSDERETQARSLPVGRCAVSSLEAQGKASSRPSCKHRRTVLTLLQR